jgi:hypothetical protein
MGDDGAVEDETIPSTGGTGPGGDAAARGWAVPGAAEQQPVADTGAPVDGRAGRPGRADASGAGGGWGAPTDERPGTPMVGPGAGAVPDVVLRPMTAADILDGGFAVLKARPRRILAVTALFVVPTQLVAAFLRRDAMGGFGFAELFSEDPTVLNEQTGDPTADMLAGLLVSVIPAIALVCVAAAIGHLVSQWIMGRDAPAGEMLGVIRRRWWALLGSFVIVKLAEGVGVFGCYIGILFIMALFVPVAPIIGVEGGGAIDVVKRSVRLVRARYFPTLGVAVLIGLVGTLLGSALSALPEAVAAWIGYDRAWPLLGLGAIVAEIVVMPFVAAATVLQYFDLRVRTEGLDLEMSAIDVLDRAA